MAKFIYHGPLSAVTLVESPGVDREVMLADGAELSLPEDNAFVQTLLALGRLTPVPEQVPALSAKQSKEEK